MAADRLGSRLSRGADGQERREALGRGLKGQMAYVWRGTYNAARTAMVMPSYVGVQVSVRLLTPSQPAA